MSRSKHLLCKESDAIRGEIQLKGLPQDGVEGLPGALIAAKGADAEACHPCQPAQNSLCLKLTAWICTHLTGVSQKRLTFPL